MLKVGQRWSFQSPVRSISYVGEIISLQPFKVKMIQCISEGNWDNIIKYSVGDIFEPATLSLSGPRLGAQGQTWYPLEGQDKPE